MLLARAHRREVVIHTIFSDLEGWRWVLRGQSASLVSEFAQWGDLTIGYFVDKAFQGWHRGAITIWVVLVLLGLEHGTETSLLHGHIAYVALRL